MEDKENQPTDVTSLRELGRHNARLQVYALIYLPLGVQVLPTRLETYYRGQTEGKRGGRP